MKHSVTVRTAGQPDEVFEADMMWTDIRSIRDGYLMDTDMWMLADRYNSLTPTQQTELTTYREALRDITTYATATEAADNFPTPPSWI